MVRARLGGKRRWDGAGRRAKTRSWCHRSLVASFGPCPHPAPRGRAAARAGVSYRRSRAERRQRQGHRAHRRAQDAGAARRARRRRGGHEHGGGGGWPLRARPVRRLDRERHRRGRVVGAIVGSNVMRLLEHVTWRAATVRRFTDLPRPFVAAATDLEPGGERGPAVLRRTGRRGPRRAAAGVSVERRPLPS